MDGSKFVGRRIAVVSKSDIRYEGTLTSIDTAGQKVTLSNVRAFGTEGRRNGLNEIPASDEAYESIVFKSLDIKDLKICDDVPKETPVKNLPTKETNSGPVSGNSNISSGNHQGKSNEGGELSGQRSHHQHQHQHQHHNQGHQRYGNNDQGGYRNQNQEGGRRFNNRGRGRGRGRGRYYHGHPVGELKGNPNQKLMEDYREDFDFQEANANFNGEEEENEENDDAFYVKDDFFDCISNSANEEKKQMDRSQRDQQMKVDTETFGDIRGARGFGRRGYRYRGYRGNRGYNNNYRGGNRGYGRGRYRNNNNSYQSNNNNNSNNGGSTGPSTGTFQ